MSHGLDCLVCYATVYALVSYITDSQIIHIFLSNLTDVCDWRTIPWDVRRADYRSGCPPAWQSWWWSTGLVSHRSGPTVKAKAWQSQCTGNSDWQVTVMAVARKGVWEKNRIKWVKRKKLYQKLRKCGIVIYRVGTATEKKNKTKDTEEV